MHANPVPLQNLAAFCTILITAVQSLNRWLCHPVICVLQVAQCPRIFRSYTIYMSHSLATLVELLYACCAVSRGCLHFHPGLRMGLGRLYEVEGGAKTASSQSATHHLTPRSQSWHMLSKRITSSSISSSRQQQGSCQCLVVSWPISCYLARNVAHAAIYFDRSPLCCRPVCQE